MSVTQSEIERRRCEVQEIFESTFGVRFIPVPGSKQFRGSVALEGEVTLECELFPSAALNAKIYYGEVAPNKEDVGVYLHPPWISPSPTVLDVRNKRPVTYSLVGRIITTYGDDPEQVTFTDRSQR